MACSEARLAANRANARKSTGPRTEAGKKVSRRNSLKHGLTGAGVVIPGEDVGEVARETAAFLAELAPDGNPTARLLAGRVAMLSVRLKRCGRHEEAATAERCRVAAIDFDEDRVAEAERLLDAIDEGPHRAELLAMPEGLDVAGVDRARMAAVDLALVDDSPESLRTRRYEAAAERAIHQALREIRRWRRPEPAPVAAPVAAPKVTPARDPLTDPSYRIPKHIVREAERMREMLIGLPPLGPGESISGLGSIFPGDDALDGFDDESMDFDDVPAPRGRSRYEDRRKRPKLGR